MSTSPAGDGLPSRRALWEEDAGRFRRQARGPYQNRPQWLFTSLCDYVLNGVCKVTEMNSSALGGGKSNPKGRPGKHIFSSVLRRTWISDCPPLSCLFLSNCMFPVTVDCCKSADKRHNVSNGPCPVFICHHSGILPGAPSATPPTGSTLVGNSDPEVGGGDYSPCAAGQLAAKFAADVAYTVKWDSALKGSALRHYGRRCPAPRTRTPCPWPLTVFWRRLMSSTVKETKDDDALQVRDAADKSKTLVSSLLSTVDGSVSYQLPAARPCPPRSGALFWYDNESKAVADSEERTPREDDRDADEAPALRRCLYLH